MTTPRPKPKGKRPSKSTTSRLADKPRKPHKDFPLFAHSAGVWAKKIRGRLRYFGPWGDPDKALQKYLDQKDDLLAGRTPRAGREGLTVVDLVNRFLTAKKARMDSGEIKAQTFNEYHKMCGIIAKRFGPRRLVDDLTAEDFQTMRAEMAKCWGPVRLANQVQRVRSLFKFGYDSGLIEKPVRFGPEFKKPSDKVLRLARKDKGKRLFEPQDIRRMLDAASPQLRAMILLGVNGGLGCTDCALLPVAALNLETGWLDYARAKTGVDRRIPLWPETVEALREAITRRPRPKHEEYKDLVFISKRGKAYGGAKETHWLVSGETAKLLTKLGLRRPGLGFYTLQHVFATVADAAGDRVAVNHIMGHTLSRNDMGAVYREKIGDDRLQVVTEFVRKWLFGA